MTKPHTHISLEEKDACLVCGKKPKPYTGYSSWENEGTKYGFFDFWKRKIKKLNEESHCCDSPDCPVCDVIGSPEKDESLEERLDSIAIAGYMTENGNVVEFNEEKLKNLIRQVEKEAKEEVLDRLKDEIRCDDGWNNFTWTGSEIVKMIKKLRNLP